jgi:four helix bundle protein
MKIMKDNVIKRKSYDFAVRIINLTRALREKKVEAAILNHLLRSGTSVSANVEEAIAAISKKEFSSKISISYKETRESMNWLRLLNDTNSMDPEDFKSIYADCDELARILFAILKKTRMSNEK